MGPHTKGLIASWSVAAVIFILAIKAEDWFGFDGLPWLIGFAVALLVAGKVVEAVVRDRDINQRSNDS